MVKRFSTLSILIALAVNAPALAAPHWSYETQAEWGELEAAFTACKTGKQQSPIDIGAAQKETLAPLVFSYQPTKVKFFNNGHTLQASTAEGNSLTIGEDSYKLVQFHFHSPSEHLIKGKSAPMELHLVHKDKDGKLAVLGVMLQAGKSNKAIEELWAHLPDSEGEKNSKELTLNIAEMLPQSKAYYTYPGSLTTPPCSENVRWLVLEQPMEVATTQVEAFVKEVGINARHVQALNERVVKEGGK